MPRSYLFVPVLEEKFVTTAADRGADAIVLDLEASIAEDRKDEARKKLPEVVSRLESKVEITVRINPLWMHSVRDLEACVINGISAVHLALCEDANTVWVINGLVTELEIERGLKPGSISLIAMLESASAVRRAEEIARSSQRLKGLTLGVEDYATSMGVTASQEVLEPAAYQVIQAAKAADKRAYVVAASMSDFRDLEGLKAAAQSARALGSNGGYAVHPDQVRVLNDVFSPTDKELDWANRVVEAKEDAIEGGQTIFKVDGNMIDAPLVTRAQEIIAKAK